MNKKILIATFSLQIITLGLFAQTNEIVLSKAELENKIRGGWAGQTIGVTFGGPYEFRFQGSFIQDYQPLTWYPGYVREVMLNNPGLYDDLYMDLSFVDILEKYGLDAPVDSFANAFANADYMLWHANQAARYNILSGMKAPQSGFWINNPHADDIDYQIESDFAGLMSPGMPNTASAISDKIGHIMNYGDGWYGGVFIGAMYTQAFTSSDVEVIVTNALKTIPLQSTFHQCINDVIRWYHQFPTDWQRTWFELQRKWSAETGCPDGVFHPFDIDAKLNAAYVVLGLLYGHGDFTKTLEIATRAGQDADCNPSSAGGILGTMIGYDHIPGNWMAGLKGAEDIQFKYTNMSLNKVYAISFQHAMKNIVGNGGKTSDSTVTILCQVPRPVKFEQSFPGIKPLARREINKDIDTSLTLEAEGCAFVLSGEALSRNPANPDYIFHCILYIDGQKEAAFELPTSFTRRRHELCWKYELANKQHTIRLEILNPDDRYIVRASSLLTYMPGK